MDSMSSTSNINLAQPVVQDAANAFITSQQVWLQGMQDVSRTLADMAQAQISRSMSNWMALSSVKSLPEALEVQKLHAIKSVNELMSCSGKLTDASMSLCQRAMAPITAQMTHSVQKYNPSAV